MSIEVQSSQNQFISDDEVSIRNEMIKNVLLYKLDLTLLKGNNYYGTVEIHLEFFEKFNPQNKLQIDFAGEKVDSVQIRKLDHSDTSFMNVKYTFERDRILIDGQEVSNKLRYQKISLLIEFKNQYNTTVQDRGLFSTVEGENQYLHSQGEVASMHYVFPCIEQINFRAAFQLSLVHPSDWVAISNQQINELKIIDDKTIQSIFETTQPFPCYLYAIYAGNYAVYQDKYKDRVNLNIYCRKEKVKFADKQIDELFQITKFGLNLMEEYTLIDYYMNKLDLVFCANYNFYGMENPGSISLEGRFNIKNYFYLLIGIIKEKRYIFEEEREPLKIMRRAYIMLHEISHLWFGDYVSLEWWNNLFLKEGFATFFGYKAVSQYFTEFNHGIHIELSKVMILVDEIQDDSNSIIYNFSFMIIFYILIKVFTLSHQKLPYHQYCSFKAHNCISYNKGGSFFQFLEKKVYGQQKFQELIRLFLAQNSFSKVDEKNFLQHFNDVYSQQYLFKNHLSYFQDNSFKDLKNLGLTEDDYKKLNLSFIVVEKQSKNIKMCNWEEAYSNQNKENIILLNTSDNHLIFSRITSEVLKFLDENNLIEKFNLQQRVTLWNSILFENIQFEKQEYLNDFFLNNFSFEKNLIILHYILRVFPKFSKSFTVEQEDTLINIYNQEKDAQTKRIICKNLIRYINSEKNIFNLLKIYETQERKVKPKYLNQLKKKIQNIYDSSLTKLDKLLNQK